MSTNDESPFARIGRETAAGLGSSAIAQRRANWEPAIRDVVMPLLERAAGEMKALLPNPGVYAQRFQAHNHFATAQLWIGKQPTGIYDQSERDWSMGVQSGGALVFSQAENGTVVVLAYPAETSLPGSGSPRSRNPWLGPVFQDPAHITSGEVERLVLLFMEFARSSSIFWAGGLPSSEVYATFARPVDIASLNVAVGDIRRQTALTAELAAWALPALCEQVGQLFERLEDDDAERVAKACTPATVRLAARVLEVQSGGALRDDDLLAKLPRGSSRGGGDPQ
jgi:hypothetical protein